MISSICKRINIFDITSIGLSGLLYSINTYLIKHITDNIFVHCYLNDIICPLFVIPFTNILLSIVSCASNQRKIKVDFQLSRIFPIVMFCFICGLYWEYESPNPNSISDPYDILCYICGGISYWTLKRLFILFQNERK